MSKFDVNKFIQYLEDWKKLDDEYNRVPKIPFYHFFKQMYILNKKGRLTNEYSKYLEQFM